MKKFNKVIVVAMSVLMSVTSASSAVLADNAKSSSSVKVEKSVKSEKLGGPVAHKKHYDVLIQYNNDTNKNWGLDLVFTDKKKAQDFVNNVYSEKLIDIKNVKLRQLTSRNLDDGVYLSNVKEILVPRENIKSIQLLE